jgi:hypothetical protein
MMDFPFCFEGNPQRAAGTNFPDALGAPDMFHTQTRVPEVGAHQAQRFLDLLLVARWQGLH